ncbi:ATP-dependent DNA ligase [Arthrobacter sp. 2RAF6]|uniref:ATP-dependent DNA ligase n=1 Tax=Arthrobacter sp. 2RAF6 TaxID=3233002 RepID=UPI003F912656
MFEGVPAALRPPVALALAKAVESIPHGDALPGGSVYEMKFDGFRAVCLVGTDGVSLWSRQNKELGRYFPDVLAAVADQVPPGCVVDGELVLWSGERLDFEGLQLRLVAARAALPALVRDHPASFVAFDVLAVAGRDTRGLPFTDRRALLEELSRHWVAPLNLSPVTRDRAVAETWFREMPATGVEGILVKGAAQPYEGGKRLWLKVKNRRSVDVVVGAVIGAITSPSEIVAGLPIDGKLRIVGRSAPLRGADSSALARWLKSPTGPHPWPAMVKGTTLDRFNRDASPVALTLVEPLVVEVSADSAWSGRSFRHALRFLRVRPELDPAGIEVPANLLTS